MSWYTTKDPEKKTLETVHSRTGATNMREHREFKRRQAKERTGRTPHEKTAAHRREMDNALAAVFGGVTSTGQPPACRADRDARGARRRAQKAAEFNR